MSDQLDRILGILDVGLQSSGEWGYGTDVSADLCSRCQSERPHDGDLCQGCRSFLLGDTDTDPANYEATDPSRRFIEALPPVRLTNIDQSEGLLCVGGPLDGRVYAHDGYVLQAVVPQPLTAYMVDDASPIAPAIETVSYVRRKVGWRNGDDVWFGSCWVLEGEDGQVVLDSLNTIAGISRLTACVT